MGLKTGVSKTGDDATPRIQTIPLPQALHWLGLEHFPSTPVGDTPETTVNSITKPASTNDKGQLNIITVSTFSSPANGDVFIRNAVMVPETPDGHASEITTKSNYGFKGTILYGGNRAPRLALKEIFYASADGQSDVIQEAAPAPQKVKGLFHAFKFAILNAQTPHSAVNAARNTINWNPPDLRLIP